MIANRPFTEIEGPFDVVLEVLEHKAFNDTLNSSLAIFQVRFVVKKLVQKPSKACVQLSRTTCIACDPVSSSIEGARYLQGVLSGSTTSFSSRNGACAATL